MQRADTPVDTAIRRYVDGSARAAGLTPHLRRLEAESIEIMREVVAQCANPVMLYSVGKDSTVMLHLARKAFWPAQPPFPLLHIATGWDFCDTIRFRDLLVQALGLRLIVHTNRQGVECGITPMGTSASHYALVMITEALKQALDVGGYDAAFGGGRRDEEPSRAKERIFSFRTQQHVWDPRNQRPELWNLYNGRVRPGESIRVFPLSNWTELDVWSYIWAEALPVVPLYFARLRPMLSRAGTLIMRDDGRLPLAPDEAPRQLAVRFRTLGCYPLTGAIESTAATVEEIIAELLASRNSERQGRLVDYDEAASMERKKREGYF